MKLERLISMIYMLLNNEVLSASALAEKYNVSQRTIYRDIEAICAAGIPVVSYQGVNGGYGIMEEYKMDKSLLGSYDVGSLITILHSMSTVFEDDRAMETINKLQTIRHDRTQSLSMDIGNRHAYNEMLRSLRAAITDRRVIRFEYINAKNERASRSVEPLRLMYKYNSWYMYGYCRTRQDYREFRISRIAGLVTSTEYFTNRHSAELPEQRSGRWMSGEATTDVVVHFSADCLAKAMDFFFDAEKTFHEDGSLTLRLKVHEPEKTGWLIPIILGFGEKAVVVEPPELKDAVKDKLRKMMENYPEV